MRITTDRESYRPDWARWYAWDADNYEGPDPDHAGDPVGTGATEPEAVVDLIDRLAMRSKRDCPSCHGSGMILDHGTAWARMCLTCAGKAVVR